MRMLLIILAAVCGACVAHADPVEVRGTSIEELAAEIASGLGTAKKPAIIKGQPRRHLEVKLIASSPKAKQGELALRGVSRQKMKLIVAPNKGSTLIQVGYRKCVGAAKCPAQPIR